MKETTAFRTRCNLGSRSHSRIRNLGHKCWKTAGESIRVDLANEVCISLPEKYIIGFIRLWGIAHQVIQVVLDSRLKYHDVALSEVCLIGDPGLSTSSVDAHFTVPPHDRRDHIRIRTRRLIGETGLELD